MRHLQYTNILTLLLHSTPNTFVLYIFCHGLSRQFQVTIVFHAVLNFSFSQDCHTVTFVTGTDHLHSLHYTHFTTVSCINLNCGLTASSNNLVSQKSQSLSHSRTHSYMQSKRALLLHKTDNKVKRVLEEKYLNS
jgi:hypothetical protein